jgi:uncharacterized membrane protein YdfJ with MMPL/SSD domain
LALHAGLDVSIFTVMLLAAIVLGAGTDYAVFSSAATTKAVGKASRATIM